MNLSTQNQTVSEQLANSTVRIVCKLEDETISTGTGFFFRLVEFEGDSHIPVIVTNKHVIKGAVEGEIVFNLADEQGNILLGSTFVFEFKSFENLWIGHPDPNVDLCVFPVGGLIEQAKTESGKIISLTQFDKKSVPSTEELSEITALEDIVMIGYPNSIWDEINNKPILRKGITATHPYLNYNGKEEFVIDAACFPGSSGSPVLLYNLMGYMDRERNINMGTRIKLLGILYAGPQHTATGEIEIVTIPTQQKPVAFSRIPNNLGYVIKSSKILDFEPILRNLIQQNN